MNRRSDRPACPFTHLGLKPLSQTAASVPDVPYQPHGGGQKFRSFPQIRSGFSNHTFTEGSVSKAGGNKAMDTTNKLDLPNYDLPEGRYHGKLATFVLGAKPNRAEFWIYAEGSHPPYMIIRAGTREFRGKDPEMPLQAVACLGTTADLARSRGGILRSVLGQRALLNRLLGQQSSCHRSRQPIGRRVGQMMSLRSRQPNKR